MSESKKELKRILIAGFPGAGLKTIKAVVVDNKPPAELKPQIQKLEISESLKKLFQMRVLLIRCGGELSLQDVFSQEHDPIYQDVESLVFVLDVSEQADFSMAKYWFDALVQHLHKFSPEARIFVLLHKVDLLGEEDNTYEYLRATKELFMMEGLDVFFHETSIFDSSIFYAFIDLLKKEAEEQISVNQYLNQALAGSSFDGVAVFSMDGLPIYEVGKLPPLVQVSANIILSSIEKIAAELEKGDEVSSTILQMKETFITFKRVNENCIFIGLTKRRPKFGQMLIESDQIVAFLKKGIS